MRRSGRSLKETINELLRRGFASPRTARKRFTIEPQSMGLHPGLNYDNTSELLDQLDGPFHR